MELLLRLVEVAHTDLTEVTRMELVKVDTVVMLTTGITATTGMLAMLANSPVAGRYVSAFLTILVQASRLYIHPYG